MSTATTYLRAARGRPNLTVITGATGRRILFDGTRAIGIEYARGGKLEKVQGGEIILSGGVFNSPQLLMLSGVGDGDHLRSVGLNTAIDLKGVGQNFHDHLGFSIQTACPLPVSDFRYIGPIGSMRARRAHSCSAAARWLRSRWKLWACSIPARRARTFRISNASSCR